MIEVALRYTDTKLPDLAFSSGVENQMEFQTVKRTDPVINSSEKSGVLLNGRKYNHVLYCHRNMEIVISSDEIDAAALEFLQEFWVAPFKYMARYDSSQWSEYRQVMTEGGPFPISYVEEIRYLPEVSFVLSYAEPEQ